MNAWRRLRLWLGGVRWYYSCGRAVLEVGGHIVAIEATRGVDRETIQRIGGGIGWEPAS